MKVALLAGGTGGTKLAHGFAMLEHVELTVIANVGDDARIHGLEVSPDIDALLYTLSGLLDTERGWGLRGDTLTAHAMFERYGRPTWFTIGDADLATHVERTRRIAEGESLTEATAGMAAALGIRPRILPVTDERYRTMIETDEGLLEFQDYFVNRRQEPEVRGLQFIDQHTVRTTRAVTDAIGQAELVIIGPSNPFVSIGPILAIREVREAIAAATSPIVAVSPIVGGTALKGPADRMLASLGHPVSAEAVARIYGDWMALDGFVIDEVDVALAPAIESLGVPVRVLPTVMRTDADRATLAAALLEETP